MGQGEGLNWPEKLTFAVTQLIVLAALIYVISARAGWYDEFYTLYVTRTELGWSEALFDHWLTDNHPPLYYVLARATIWLGESLEARRVLNLLIGLAAFAGAFLATIKSTKEVRTIAIFYFVNLVAQNALIEMVGELRSYFMSYCSVALVILMVTVLWCDSTAFSRTRRVVMWAAIVVAFNTHIVTTVITALLLVPFVGLALLRRDYLRFRELALPAVGAGALFLATVAVQLPIWMGNTQNFWLPGGLGQALKSYQAMISAASVGHVLMTIMALLGMFMLVANLIRTKKPEPRLEIIMLLLLGVALACAVLLGLHLYRPLIIPKYLAGCFPPIAMIVAIAFVSALDIFGSTMRGVLTVMVGLFGIQDIGRNVATIEMFGGWDETAREVSRQVANCPGAVVHPGLHWNTMLRSQYPSDAWFVWAYTYQQVAKRHGFQVEGETSVRTSRNCPTLFWGQIAGQPMPYAQELLNYQQARGFAVSASYIYKIGTGWIASDRPLSDLGPFQVK